MQRLKENWKACWSCYEERKIIVHVCKHGDYKQTFFAYLLSLSLPKVYFSCFLSTTRWMYQNKMGEMNQPIRVRLARGRITPSPSVEHCCLFDRRWSLRCAIFRSSSGGGDGGQPCTDENTFLSTTFAETSQLTDCEIEDGSSLLILQTTWRGGGKVLWGSWDDSRSVGSRQKESQKQQKKICYSEDKNSSTFETDQPQWQETNNHKKASSSKRLERIYCWHSLRNNRYGFR